MISQTHHLPLRSDRFKENVPGPTDAIKKIALSIGSLTGLGPEAGKRIAEGGVTEAPMTTEASCVPGDHGDNHHRPC